MVAGSCPGRVAVSANTGAARASNSRGMQIVITAAAVDGGTEVTIEEEPTSGLARTLHNPVLDLLVRVRLIETLRRLENLTR